VVLPLSRPWVRSAITLDALIDQDVKPQTK